jgi:hypothetical protein
MSKNVKANPLNTDSFYLPVYLSGMKVNFKKGRIWRGPNY